MNNRFRKLAESRKLEMLQMSIEEIYNAGYEDAEKLNSLAQVYKNFAKQFQKKSPNQRRADLIQRARRFVEVKFEPHWRIKNLLVIPIDGYVYTAEFIINSKKRTVVALLRMVSSKQVIFKGKAKCAPGDVFNEWIGKAIALARALEIEVPAEFLNAVQPIKVVKGAVYSLGGKMLFVADESTSRFKFSKNIIIKNDTNAEYEVAS